jgi:hypothetical protein
MCRMDFDWSGQLASLNHDHLLALQRGGSNLSICPGL